ncbi:MAG: GNAT family N-acetyltransferase [Marmoricola sp.]
MHPLGWHTDLAVLRLGGSTVEDRGDHLVITTPANPSYWWGNFLLVTDPEAVHDPARWLDAFEQQFPDAEHRAIGLVAEPADPQAWLDLRLFLEYADVLVTHGPVAPGPLADGYRVKILGDGDDWERSTRMRQLAFPTQDEFEAKVTETRIAIAPDGAETWFGAFLGDELAAELGIADCGDGVARYRSVVTHPDHRRRGLTRHLLAVAAAHATERGASTVVIVADADTDAGRLYRSAGFSYDSTAYQASRVPQPPDPGRSDPVDHPA